MSSELPPTYYFTDITFNPTFYSNGSDNITNEEAKKLILNYTTSGTSTITTLSTSTINSLGSTLTIGTNGVSSDTVLIGTNSNAQTKIYGGAIGLLNNTTVLGNLTSNSYNLSGTSTSLTKASLGYYINFTRVSASYATSNKFLYSPSSNTSIGYSHYLNAGVYMANIHMYLFASAGQTYSSTFSLGVSTGTNIQSMPVKSDFIATNSGATITGNYFVFSHSGCFTLTSSSFVNLEFNLKVQSGATQTYNLYGCIHRIA